MSFTIDYQFKGNKGTLRIETGSVSYLDLSEEKPIAYVNPVAGPSCLLLAGRQDIFVVHEGKGFRLTPEQPFARAGLTLAWRPEEISWGKIQPYLQKGLHWVRTERKKSLVLAFTAVGLFFVAFLFSYFGSEKQKLTPETVGQTTVELKGDVLLATRLKLAERAMEEGSYTLAADLTDKVLAGAPANPQAIALKEKIVAALQASQKESQIEVKKEIRFKEVLDEATALMAAKDYQGALFQVQQVLEAEPQHAEAYRMREAIQKELAKLEQEQIQTIGAEAEHLEKSEALWQEGMRALEEKNYRQAWKHFTAALDLLKERNLQPPFRVDLKEHLAKTEEALAEQIRPLMDQARALRDLGQSSQGEKKAEYYQEALGRYYQALEIYPSFAGLQDETDLVIHRLDKALEPFFVEGQTMMDLEGCCPSHPHFKKVMGLAKYDSVPLYNRAKEILETCPCK